MTSTPTKPDTSLASFEIPPRLDDSLFRYIEDTQLQEGVPFGRLLDAGTGSHSLRWIAGLIHHISNEKKFDDMYPLTIKSFGAITADERMRKTVMAEAKRLHVDKNGDILIGNWATESPKVDNTSETRKVNGGSHTLLAGEVYDTIIADYLIGAMDGFSPYFQDMIIPRLVQHLAPGGYLYIVGLEPIPDKVPKGDDADAKVITEVTKVRDACILLAGHRCYREYPLSWILRNIESASSASDSSFTLEIVDSRKFPIMYSYESIARQIRVGRSKLPLFSNEQLKVGMEELLDSLDTQSKRVTNRSRTGRIKLGFDYVVCVKRTS